MGDDNRIRLDLMPVPFPPDPLAVVEETGGLHDSYPAPRTGARYDLIRSYLIGLLSNQSGQSEPLEKRTGTFWYKRTADGTKEFVKVHTGQEISGTGGSWSSLSDHIGLTIDSEDLSLTEVITQIMITLEYAKPRVVWSGEFTYDNNNNSIQIPSRFYGYAAIANMRAMVYVDGLLIDPRITSIIPGETAYIAISDAFQVKPGQKYSVILEYVTDLEQDTIYS